MTGSGRPRGVRLSAGLPRALPSASANGSLVNGIAVAEGAAACVPQGFLRMATPSASDQIDLGFLETPRPLTAVGAAMVTGGYEHPPHSHRKAQLVFAPRGFVTCLVKEGLWMVAPQCALWVPGGVEHSIRVSGNLELYILLVDPDMKTNMPRDCCTLAVSPLLRELLIEASHLPPLYEPGSTTERLMNTLLDQLEAAPMERLHLPMPADPRLQKIAVTLVEKPSDRATLGEWAKRVSMSERTLNRLIVKQTGMSFGRWRQQCQIMFALKRMAEGEAVKSIAFELGYETPSAFILMFKKVLGQSPGRYKAERDSAIALHS